MTDFTQRHLGVDAAAQQEMLALLGYDDLEQLLTDTVPPAIRLTEPLDLPAARSEAQVQQRLTELAAANRLGAAMIGLGYHQTITPPAIRRLVLENPAWYTAYTPYQPEISQGRLEVLATFQTVIADLTGLPVAGASLLDEATAVAEAVTMAHRATKLGDTVLVEPGLLPQSLAVLRTRTSALGIEVATSSGPLVDAIAEHAPFAVVVQVPAADGHLRSAAELREIAEAVHARGGLMIVAVDLLALTLIGSAAEWGADIAVGSSQRFGVPLFYGGPHAGFIATRNGLERQLPGRVVGLSKDADGVPAYRLALQTREQHIRREKATSNICTAQVLLAVAAALYAVHHGPDGLTEIATDVHQQTRRLAAALAAAGVELTSQVFFDTVSARVPGRAAQIVDAAREAGCYLRLIDADQVGISVGEGIGEDELAAVCGAFGIAAPTAAVAGGLGDHRRTSDLLTHPVFHAYRSETEFMRYLRTLADRDFALDKGMIPLGSCTMKLNPAAAMEPISYPGFAGLHPFVPAEDARGYADLIAELCDWLAEITGYDSVSLQPNAGSQGEFSGLMAIRSWHLANGNAERDICLIPASAHGTNAASAVMAGMRVVVVATAADGSVDLPDLHAKIAQHADRLAAVMVTYPSTHGVFEDTITEICSAVHDAGGQVYVDGANLNALLGLARPGRFGADVSHLNLHKTFAIPHGGGGPGVGPVAVRAHLAPYLPNHPLVDAGPETSYGPVSAAPFGSAGVLPISWAYIALMGPDGLRASSAGAILAANYVARRLQEHYPVLYAGASGRVAHECIIDLRELTKRTGVSVDDVAKRLIDYGFHAPTMSFPVAGTLMIEPTESESKAELDRFCDAMIAIKGEIDQVLAGVWPADDNPLHNAPHPQLRIVADEWPHPYSRQLAAFPAGLRPGPVASGGRDKYWPAVSRIDGAFGDRNLVCTCGPVADYAEGTSE
ncbi:MAG: glycine dehydrogenase (aminomethyl-transferring) [Actinobacteria bacterium HGW-Actinobacteria-2]|nr:MAG: glycine dehydrogenase (aminomethyl-transferring) [Actinobacteria bacterium HGW-Actinobacteria-2]